MATWGLGMMSLVGQNGNTSHWANARVSVPMMRSFSRFIFAELHMRLSVRLFLVCGAVSLFANTVACAAEQLPAGSRAGVVRVGLERNLGPDFLIESFAPTMRLLRREKPNTTFKTTFYTAGELAEAVRERRTDIFFADSALFGVLQLEAGAIQLATRTAPYAADPSKATSFAVVVRRGSEIKKLSDLPGKKIAAEDPGSFSTWLLFQGVLKNLGALEEGWDRAVRFTGYQLPDPILLVQQAAVDAAVVPACRLETLIDMNVVHESELDVLNEQSATGFPCRRSADLFPDIVLGVASGVDPDLASAIAVTVMSAPPFRP